ncbi:hypothetical protein GJAV_G00040290 [Gymnothorax javanicus]|nr:hypothetical protein GJAV_G00040290 [Gymnothorax javanicus]
MEPSQMSFLYFLVYAAAAGGLLPLLGTETGSAQEFKVKGGTQQLSERLAELVGRENILLGSAVTAIEQRGDVVHVKTATECFTCKAVIVTCPPHLAAKICYSPALPTERDRLTQSMPVGHLIKFIITYPTAFWREKGFSGEIVAQASASCPFSVTFDATSPNGNPALVGFIAAEQACDWGGRTVETRRESIILSLEKYLGPAASGFIHYEERDWAREEFSGGCPVNIMAPGMLSFYHPSLRKPCGRIFWAGTETATLWCGYMSGAVQSGQQAALEVLGFLSPKSLSQSDTEVAGVPRNRRDQCKASITPKHFLSSTLLKITMVTLGAVIVLARPQLSRDLIGRALAFLQKDSFNQ